MLRQLDLFAAPTVAPEITFDRSFGSLERKQLAYGAWFDYQQRFVIGHDALFEKLERTLAWRTENRKMYDRVVATPRLLAKLVPEGELAIFEDIRRALSEHYGEAFVRTTAALYRDGSDSVAFHGDTVARNLNTALVATVSLGQPRRFLLKATEGGASISYQLGHGDLCVMGGTCQRTWRHGIPKVAAAGPRIAVMFRPAWSASYDG